MVEPSHVIPRLRRSSTTRRPSMRAILASNEAVSAATATVARTPDAETNQQPRGEKRKAGALSGDREKGADSGTSDVDSEASEEGPSVPKKKKGKEREHTPEEDSQEESVAKNNGSNEQLSEDEDDDDDDDDDEALHLEEEDLDDDDEEPLYHHEIWNRLVNLANYSGSYVHPPAKGDEPEDVTAFNACSASWGMDRANRPHVLSLWMPRTPQNNPDYDIEHLTYNGRVVLDWEGEPIRNFRELPATIASMVEGWRVEAWLRRDKRVTYRDIVARMRTKAGAGGRVPIYGTRALATRASNFRDHAGCVSWRLLASKARSRAYIDGLRTPIQRRHNLTTHQDLSSAQLHAYYSMSRSRYSSATAGNAGPSAPGPNAAGSSNAGASRRSRRKATNSGAAGSDTPGPSTPLRRSGRRKSSRLCQPGSPRNEAGEHNEHEQYESDDDKRLLDTSLIDEDEEEAALETSLVDESEDEELFDTSLFDEGAEEALVDTNLINEGEEEAQVPDPISLKEGGERLDDSVSGSSDDDSNDSASEYSISGEPEDHNDARNHIPADINEATMLQAALDATREDFKRLTGREPTMTDPMENYLSQWAAYQTQLNAFLHAQGQTDDQTILVGLGGWGGGISNWRSARPALGESTGEN